MEIPLSRLKTLRNADIRRVDNKDKSDLFEHRVEYEGQFYSYDMKGKPYNEVIEVFTSNRAYARHFTDIRGIELCLAKVYYKGKLTGIETVMLWCKEDANGLKIYSDVARADDLRRVCHAYGLYDTIYNVINQRVINLQFDSSCTIRYTNRYLRGDFKPFVINVSIPYINRPYYYCQPSLFLDESKVEVQDKIRLRDRLVNLANQNLVPYINPKILTDFNCTENFRPPFNEKGTPLTWKDGVE